VTHPRTRSSQAATRQTAAHPPSQQPSAHRHMPHAGGVCSQTRQFRGRGVQRRQSRRCAISRGQRACPPPALLRVSRPQRPGRPAHAPCHQPPMVPPPSSLTSQRIQRCTPRRTVRSGPEATRVEASRDPCAGGQILCCAKLKTVRPPFLRDAPASAAAAAVSLARALRAAPRCPYLQTKKEKGKTNRERSSVRLQRGFGGVG